MIYMVEILWRGVARSFGLAGIFAALLLLGVVFAPRWKRRTGAIYARLVIVPYFLLLTVGLVMRFSHLTLVGVCGLAIALIALIYGAGSIVQMLLRRTKP
ncbi:MAG: hypothetical protein ACR2JW_03895 [Thermomicrobiales bacterium]